MRIMEHTADFCVVGGGMAGLCAALAAARHGIRTVLIQDRGVLGGNASSEIRMWICGAHGENNRETGIVEELMLENFYQNPQLSYPLWDGVLFQKASMQENLTLLLNTSCTDARCDGGRIVSVTAWEGVCETRHVVSAKFFADCSGDSILAPLTGAHYRYGREACSKFDESIEPETADQKTMGMSCLFQVRETDSPKKFTPPSWAYSYPTDADLPFREHDLSSNFWWIELGGDGDAIHDTDRYRDELYKSAYGVWDHIKNHGDHGAENFQLEWVGMLPGKRESRRYVGKTTVTQNDVRAEGRFEDVVGYAGWTMDDHFPAGMNHKTSYPTVYHAAPSPWGIPFRALCSENVENLLFAGRNISVTHAALSSSRVMATCAVLGQAVGTAAAQMVKNGQTTDTVDIDALQQTLMADDCYLPFVSRRVSELSERVACSNDTVHNGKERGEENLWVGKAGDFLEYAADEAFDLSGVRLVLDSNLNRDYQNMPCCIRLHEPRFKLPDTLIRDFDLVLTDEHGKETTLSFREQHNRLIVIPCKGRYRRVRFVPLATHGADTFRVFDFEIF